MKTLFLLILLAFPLGQLCRLELTNLTPGLVLHPVDFLIFLFVLVWVIGKMTGQIKKLLFGKEIFAFLFFCLLSFLINLPRFGFTPASFFYLLRVTNYFLFFWAAVDFLKENKIPVMKLLFFEGVVVSIFSLVQYFFLPDTRFLFNLGWDMHYYRAIGVFLDPSFNGLICVFSFFIFLNYVFLDQQSLNKQKKAIIKILFFLGGGIILLAIALSFSRLSYLALLIGSGILLLSKKTMKILLLTFLSFVVLVIFIPKPTGEGVDLLRKSSFISRFDNYKKTTTIIRENLFFGVGFNNFRLIQKKYGFLQDDWQASHSGAGADNSFLFVFATTGILGIAAYLYFWAKIANFIIKTKNSHQKLVLATLLALLVSSFAINSLFYPWVLIWFYLLLAMFTAEAQK